MSPTLQLIAFSTPANGARRVCSIFITSRVRIGAPFSSCGADLGQQRHHGARQRRHDLVLADLLLVVAAERIDPVQVEAAVAGPQIELVALDDGEDVRLSCRAA